MNKRSNLDKVVQLELLISRLLQIGVTISSIIILAGFMLYLFTGNGGYRGNTYPKSELGIFNGLIALKPYAIILTGLFLLILTPVFRVGVSIFIFYRERDYLYVLITVTVFMVLLVGFFLGKVL